MSVEDKGGRETENIVGAILIAIHTLGSEKRVEIGKLVKDAIAKVRRMPPDQVNSQAALSDAEFEKLMGRSRSTETEGATVAELTEIVRRQVEAVLENEKAQETETQFRKVLGEIFPEKEKIDPDTDLGFNDLFDSDELKNLLEATEAHFKIRIPFNMMLLEGKTIQRWVNLIMRYSRF